MGQGPGGEWLTMTEAATVLGVHRNTIRNRCKAGRYASRLLTTARGTEYLVSRAALEADSGGAVRTRAHKGAPHKGAQRPPEVAMPGEPIEATYTRAGENDSQPVALVPLAAVADQLQGLADRLADMALEVGKLRERTATQQETIDALRRRAEAAEAALEQTRIRPTDETRVSSPPSETRVSDGTTPRPWWRRLFGGE